MTNWNSLEQKLLDMLFAHNKFMEVKTTIVVFSQGAKKLCEKRESYKSMLRKCINHIFDYLTRMHIFRNEL